MDERSESLLRLRINARDLGRVVIDQHYRAKHTDLTDELILALVTTLDNRNFEIEKKLGAFEYFAVEPVVFQDKPYRLVLLRAFMTTIWASSMRFESEGKRNDQVSVQKG